MINIVIILIFVVCVFFAAKTTLKHFAGKGGCCGGGSSIIRETKILDKPIIATKIVEIGGMTCENCAARVEIAVNKIDGVACKVDLKKNTAEISLCQEVSDELIKTTIEDAGYKVINL